MKIDRKIFFDNFRAAFGSLTQVQVDNLNSLLTAIDLDREWLKLEHDVARKQIAYVLATAKHETSHDFVSKEEIGKGRGRVYGVPVQISANRFVAYYGRGLVQLTWLANYARASFVCGVDLVNEPERALLYPYCYTILADGMRRGWFTGRKISDYINDGQCDYTNARRVVNGTDCADLIAGYAQKFEGILQAAIVIKKRVE
jgi:hypothetical protein